MFKFLQLAMVFMFGGLAAVNLQRMIQDPLIVYEGSWQKILFACVMAVLFGILSTERRS